MGPLEKHHVVPRATIKGQYSYWHGLMEQVREERGLPSSLPLLEEALLDRRNLLVVCRFHHELISGHRIYVPAASWPEGIWDFARETGLVWWLEKWSEAA
jgi:hypothetical protein